MIANRKIIQAIFYKKCYNLKEKRKNKANGKRVRA
jgi:hypothetical protein